MEYPTAWPKFHVWGNPRGPRTRQVLTATRALMAGTALAATVCVFYANNHRFHLFSGISDNVQLNGIAGKKMPPKHRLLLNASSQSEYVLGRVLTNDICMNKVGRCCKTGGWEGTGSLLCPVESHFSYSL